MEETCQEISSQNSVLRVLLAEFTFECLQRKAGKVGNMRERMHLFKDRKDMLEVSWKAVMETIHGNEVEERRRHLMQIAQGFTAS